MKEIDHYKAMAVVIANSVAELEGWRQPWDDLSDKALERNVFYEHWMLLPAMRHLAAGESVQIVLVTSAVLKDTEGRPLLIGVFPFASCTGYRHLPIRFLSLWRYAQCFLCTPLVRADASEECFTQFFSWVDSAAQVGTMVRMTYIRGDGPFYEQIKHFVKAHRRVVDETSFERAMLQSKLDGDAYIHAALSNKGRREFERQGRRLAEQGRIEVKELQKDDDIDYWIYWLLELEKRGWKGKAGTALALRLNEKTYYEEIARAAFERGQLLMEMMTLNGTPIAIRCTFLSGSCSYGMKIAYDEEYGRFSPGVQLEFDVIRRSLANPAIEWMDSCAEPDHPMFNRLWRERRIIRHINISTRKLRSKLLIKLMTAGREGGRFVRRLRERCRGSRS